MPEDAFRVHGLSAEFLRQHPIFSAVANDFEDFVNQSTLVIHNAGFDMKFIHHAFGLLGRDFAAPETIVDTLMMARRRFPGASATLDALCKRFGVNAKNRVKHGALIDAELLADVYIAMTAPRTAQKSLQLDPPPSSVFYVAGPPLKPEDQEMRAASDEERQRHHQFLASIGIDHWPHIQTENQSI
jgi:DNA polymerase-3 subunit epsilon